MRGHANILTLVIHMCLFLAVAAVIRPPNPYIGLSTYGSEFAMFILVSASSPSQTIGGSFVFFRASARINVYVCKSAGSRMCIYAYLAWLPLKRYTCAGSSVACVFVLCQCMVPRLHLCSSNSTPLSTHPVA